MDSVPNGQHGENEYDSLKQVSGSYKKVGIINSPNRVCIPLLNCSILPETVKLLAE